MQICLAHAVEYHMYTQKTGNESFDFSWELTESDKIVVEVRGNGEFFQNICDPFCRTIEWHYCLEGTEIRAVRDGDVIRINGTFNNKPFIKGFKIDDNPWYQPLSYSLRCFLVSSEKEALFWMIRPDTLDVIKFKIRKLQKEHLIFNGRSTHAIKMELGLTSLLEGLWKSHYWFREEDGLFIQYRGIHGVPGTPETVIRLIE